MNIGQLRQILRDNVITTSRVPLLLEDNAITVHGDTRLTDVRLDINSISIDIITTTDVVTITADNCEYNTIVGVIPIIHNDHITVSSAESVRRIVQETNFKKSNNVARQEVSYSLDVATISYDDYVIRDYDAQSMYEIYSILQSCLYYHMDGDLYDYNCNRYSPYDHRETLVKLPNNTTTEAIANEITKIHYTVLLSPELQLQCKLYGQHRKMDNEA